MATDAGIPFRNLTIREADKLLDAVRKGMGPRMLADFADVFGFDRATVEAFCRRNREAVAEAMARRPA